MNTEETAQKILTYLEKHETLSSWQLKTALRLQLSEVYLALGFLSARGKIAVEPQGLNYKVTLIK